MVDPLESSPAQAHPRSLGVSHISTAPNTARPINSGPMTLGLCTFNRGDKIISTLEAITKLDRADGRLLGAIIIDNKSTDNTAAVIDEFISNHAKVDPTFLIRRVHEPRPGKANAIERLFVEIDSAGTEPPVVGMIDDDTLPEKNWARGMLSLLDDIPRAGAVGGPVRIVWEDGPTPIATIYKRSLGDQLLGEQRVKLADPASFLMGASVAVRMQAVRDSKWRELRSMDTHRGKSLQTGEDAEICLRIRNAGWEIWYEPSAAMGHLIPHWRTTPEYIAKLRESICRSEPMIKWLSTPGVDAAWARANARRAKVLWWKTRLFDWRPTRRRVRLAERFGRVRGWNELVEWIDAHRA